MRSGSSHAQPIYDRFFFLATFAVTYVGLAALSQVGARPAPLAVLFAAPLGLALVWRRTREADATAATADGGPALGAVRVCAWGTALWFAARSGPAGRPAFDLAANFGVGGATVAACVALARIAGPRGLIQPPRSARSLDAAALCALLWGVATALPAARALWPGKNLLLDPLSTDYATSAASIASVLALMALALRVRYARRLELGVPDRAAGALALSLTAFSIAVPAALANLATHDRALPLGALGAALACVWAATTPQPTSVSSSLRGALVVMVLGAPIALVTALVARHLPEAAGGVVLAGCAATLAVGLLARAVARPLAPEQSRWLDALTAATRAALEPEPHAAVVATLQSLQRLEPSAPTRPELWRVDPPEVLSVDRAGYLCTEPAAAPQAAYALAREEPERLLRRDVLQELSVRRPDVRPVLGWMEGRDAFAVTLIYEEQTPLGLLLLPRGSRRRPASLEEARAARTLAERLGAVLSVSSSLARSRAREQRAARQMQQDAARIAELEQRLTERARPRDVLADTLAARVRVAAFSATAQLALEQLTRAANAGGDLSLEVPIGVDALAWASAFHVASPRRDGPLVVVDGATTTATSVQHWLDPKSAPSRRAAGGTLLLLHPEALPFETQDTIAIELARRSTEPEPAATFSLLAAVREPTTALLERRLLSRALAQLIEPSCLRLPALVERPEDLRGLVLDQLCKSGVRSDGAPLGVEPEALRLLIDHAWPGNEAELSLVVTRAARLAGGERITAGDLAAAGFAQVEPRDVPEPPHARSGSPARRVDSGFRSSVARAIRPSAVAAAQTEPSRAEREPSWAVTERPSPRRRRRR